MEVPYALIPLSELLGFSNPIQTHPSMSLKEDSIGAATLAILCVCKMPLCDEFASQALGAQNNKHHSGDLHHMSSEACHGFLSTGCLCSPTAQILPLLGFFHSAAESDKQVSGIAESGGQGPAQCPQDFSELGPQHRMGKTQGLQGGGVKLVQLWLCPGS